MSRVEKKSFCGGHGFCPEPVGHHDIARAVLLVDWRQVARFVPYLILESSTSGWPRGQEGAFLSIKRSKPEDKQGRSQEEEEGSGGRWTSDGAADNTIFRPHCERPYERCCDNPQTDSHAMYHVYCTRSSSWCATPAPTTTLFSSSCCSCSQPLPRPRLLLLITAMMLKSSTLSLSTFP
jgi:hypothetical protein